MSQHEQNRTQDERIGAMIRLQLEEEKTVKAMAALHKIKHGNDAKANVSEQAVPAQHTAQRSFWQRIIDRFS